MIGRDANVRNNAMQQPRRLAAWTHVRDALWRVLDPLIDDGARVALVGGGSCDDIPLTRIVERATTIDLIDLDRESMRRAIERLDPAAGARVTAIECDVMDGCAELILNAVRETQPLPEQLALPCGPIGSGDYDLVVGDMLYTQLLHPGLLALGVHGIRQHELMRTYDPQLTRALVRRIQASIRPGGRAVHVHDLACWSMPNHDQPMSIEAALAEPDVAWLRLRRHDGCDPVLRLGELGFRVQQSSWWRWDFSSEKQFVVRASLV